MDRVIDDKITELRVNRIAHTNACDLGLENIVVPWLPVAVTGASGRVNLANCRGWSSG